MGLIPGSERSAGGGHGNPLQSSYLKNPMDRGAWWATVHRVAKSQTQLKQLSTHTCLFITAVFSWWSNPFAIRKCPSLIFFVLKSISPDIRASLVAQRVKCLPAMQETWVRSLGQEDPLEKEMATHSCTLAWKSHGQRSLVDYSPWGRKESDTTEWLNWTSLSDRYLKVRI